MIFEARELGSGRYVDQGEIFYESEPFNLLSSVVPVLISNPNTVGEQILNIQISDNHDSEIVDEQNLDVQVSDNYNSDESLSISEYDYISYMPTIYPYMESRFEEAKRNGRHLSGLICFLGEEVITFGVSKFFKGVKYGAKAIEVMKARRLKRAAEAANWIDNIADDGLRTVLKETKETSKLRKLFESKSTREIYENAWKKLDDAGVSNKIKNNSDALERIKSFECK